MSTATSTISELSAFEGSSLVFSGDAGGGWSLLGDVGTLGYGVEVLGDISVCLRLYERCHLIVSRTICHFFVNFL